MDETPILARHPLQKHLTAAQGDIQAKSTPGFIVVKPPGPKTDTNGRDRAMDSGSETEGMSSGGEEEDRDDEDEPMTQQIDPRPLAGVMVYVDVRSGDGCENRSQAIAHQLDMLGATVCERLTKDVTHVVFKDGKPTTKERAEKKGVYLVSPLWVDACKRTNEQVSEAKYPSLCKEGCDSPVVLGKIKRLKSMQPKPLEEEIAKSLERSRKRHKTDDKATLAKRKKALKSTSKSLEKEYDLSGSESENERDKDKDSFELPEVDFLVTPVALRNSREKNPDLPPTVTPESVVEKTKKEVKKQVTPSTTDKTPLKAMSGNKKKTASGQKSSKSGGKQKQQRRQSRNKENEKVGNSETTTTEEVKDKEEGSATKPKRRRVQFRGSPFQKTKPSLVLTSVDAKNQEIIHSLVKKLGKFEITRTVCDNTTHVVCGNPRRTINILAGTAMGCWILPLEWVWESLDSGYWLKEEQYEMFDHFPSARFFRLERQAAGLLYRPSLFSSVGSVFVSSDSSPPSQQLERLLMLGGGKVSGSHRKADICIGCKSWSEEVKSVSEQWVLDSITEHKLLPLEDYFMDRPHPRAPSPEL